MTELAMTQTVPASVAWAQVRDTFRMPRRTVAVCARADLTAKVDQLKADYLQAAERDSQSKRKPTAPAIGEQINAAIAEMRDSMVTFTFEGLGRKAESDLRAAHPPTQKQAAVAQLEGLTALFNADTFWPALLAACSVEPTGMTVEDWTTIYHEWPLGAVEALRMAVLQVNNSAPETPRGVGA